MFVSAKICIELNRSSFWHIVVYHINYAKRYIFAKGEKDFGIVAVMSSLCRKRIHLLSFFFYQFNVKK